MRQVGPTTNPNTTQAASVMQTNEKTNLRNKEKDLNNSNFEGNDPLIASGPSTPKLVVRQPAEELVTQPMSKKQIHIENKITEAEEVKEEDQSQNSEIIRQKMQESCYNFKSLLVRSPSQDMLSNVYCHNSMKAKIRDGFNIPIGYDPIAKKQRYLCKSAIGYYKERMMAIQNHELYIYPDRHS